MNDTCNHLNTPIRQNAELEGQVRQKSEMLLVQRRKHHQEEERWAHDKAELNAETVKQGERIVELEGQKKRKRDITEVH